jgi:HEAT repeat protein
LIRLFDDEDEDPQVRKEAALSLTSMGDEQALGELNLNV